MTTDLTATPHTDPHTSEAYSYTDPTDAYGNTLTVVPVQASMYYGEIPVVSLGMNINPGYTDTPETPIVYVPLDAVEEVITAIRAAANRARGTEQTPRRILTEAEYTRAYRATRAARNTAPCSESTAIAEAITATLAAVGILAPPPEADPDTCTAMYADPHGDWWQCTEDPGHDTANGHDAGDWSWSHGAPDSIPPAADQAPRAADTA